MKQGHQSSVFNMRQIAGAFLCAILVSPVAQAQPGQDPGSLPPGLQKKVEQGKRLPPGWERKLELGRVLDRDIYRYGDVLYRNRDDGHVTVRIENKVVRLIENSLEIIAILDDI